VKLGYNILYAEELPSFLIHFAINFSQEPKWIHKQFSQRLKLSWKVLTRRLQPYAARPNEEVANPTTATKAGVYLLPLARESVLR
jgi:hypothetical protein